MGRQSHNVCFYYQMKLHILLGLLGCHGQHDLLRHSGWRGHGQAGPATTHCCSLRAPLILVRIEEVGSWKVSRLMERAGNKVLGTTIRLWADHAMSILCKLCALLDDVTNESESHRASNLRIEVNLLDIVWVLVLPHAGYIYNVPWGQCSQLGTLAPSQKCPIPHPSSLQICAAPPQTYSLTMALVPQYLLNIQITVWL